MSYFNWPACVAVIAVVAMLRFHEQVGRMFDRIKSLGIKGAIFGPGKQEPGKELAVAPSNAEKLLHGWDNPILVEHEGNLRQYMDGLNIADSAERERVLIRFLASAHIGQSFDRIYYNIFGSQLRALNVLNGSSEGLPRIVTEAFYEFGKSVEPDWYTNFSYGSWLAFLSSWFLVTVVKITAFGTEFLKYLLEQKLTLEKRG